MKKSYSKKVNLYDFGMENPKINSGISLTPVLGSDHHPLKKKGDNPLLPYLFRKPDLVLTSICDRGLRPSGLLPP